MNGNEIQILCINCTDLLPYGYFDVCCAIEYERLGTFFFTLCVFIPVVFFLRIQCPTWRLWVWFIIGETKIHGNNIIWLLVVSLAWIIITWYLLKYFQRHFFFFVITLFLICTEWILWACVLIVEFKNFMIKIAAYARSCFDFNLRTWEKQKATNGRHTHTYTLKNCVLNQSSVNILKINAFNLNVFYMVKKTE